jgi:hypothetical protein
VSMRPCVQDTGAGASSVVGRAELHRWRTIARELNDSLLVWESTTSKVCSLLALLSACTDRAGSLISSSVSIEIRKENHLCCCTLAACLR